MAAFWAITDGILRWPKPLATAPERTVSQSAGQLDFLLAQVDAITLSSWNLISGRMPADLTRGIQPESWSVAQCFAHLAQTTNAFLPPISQAISRAPHLNANRRLRTGTLASVFIRNMEPPYRLRFKVMEGLVPTETEFLPAWQAFEVSQDQLVKTIQSASGLAIDTVEIASPVYARFRYNIYGALRMLTAHQRRHLWQMEQTLNAFDLSGKTSS